MALKGGEARVYLADGKAVPNPVKISAYRDLPVKLLFNRDTTVIDAAAQRAYAGAHLLASDKPRYVGVRFRRRAGDKGESAGVVSVAVMKP